MQLDVDGTPLVLTTGDQDRLDQYLDRLTDVVYGRLPWLVKRFLSRNALRDLLGLGTSSIIARIR